MLYFLHGTDTDKAREKAHETLAVLQKKKPGAELFRFESDGWSDPENPTRGEARLDELIASQGLFERKFIVFVNRLFENAEAKETIVKKLSALAKSENIFIFLEGKVDKPTLLLITEVSDKVQVFDMLKGKPKLDFSLTDAFGRRDRKNLWVLYQKAVASGAVPEEIHGILFWQVKNMILASETGNAEEAGLSPFPFMKAKQFLKNYTPKELKQISSKLVTLYHDSHRGIHNFEIALERFVLTI